jgi:chitodextrinase
MMGDIPARFGELTHMTHVSRFRTGTRATARVLLCGLIAGTFGCTLKETEAPSFSGPSEFAQSITVSVSPDILTQDGSSQSLITVSAKGINGEPLRNISLRNEITVGGMAVDFGTLSARNAVTGTDGRATFVYTAPPSPAVAVDAFTVVDILVWPVGSDFNNATPRTASIRLVPPGAVAPPDGLVAAFEMSNANPLDHETVIFDASTSRSNASNPITSYRWSFGDGATASGQVVTHDYDEAGTYAVRLTIGDAFGREKFTVKSIIVGAGSDPTAAFVVSPTGPKVNTQVNFNAAGSRAATGRSIVSYRWDFGDGTPLVTTGEPTVGHTYRLAQSYTVTLTVTDDSGKTGSISTAVSILP